MSAKRINQDRSEGLDDDVFEQLLADVRGHIFSTLNWNVLAEKANLSYSTIAALAYGDTKSPHLRTVIKIMTALGKEHPILDAFKAEEPVSVPQASKRKTARLARLGLRKKRKEKLFRHRTRRRAARQLERQDTMH